MFFSYFFQYINALERCHEKLYEYRVQGLKLVMLCYIESYIPSRTFKKHPWFCHFECGTIESRILLSLEINKVLKLTNQQINVLEWNLSNFLFIISLRFKVQKWNKVIFLMPSSPLPLSWYLLSVYCTVLTITCYQYIGT